MCFYLMNLETPQAKAHPFRSGGNSESVFWGITWAGVNSKFFFPQLLEGNSIVCIIREMDLSNGECNVDWKVLTETQVTGADLRDLMQCHKNLPKGQSVTIVVYKDLHFGHRLFLGWERGLPSCVEDASADEQLS